MTYQLTDAAGRAFETIWADLVTPTESRSLSYLHQWGRFLGVPRDQLDAWESECGMFVSDEMTDADMLHILAQELALLVRSGWRLRQSHTHFLGKFITLGYEARMKSHDAGGTKDKKRNMAPEGKRRLDNIMRELRGTRSNERRKELERERDQILRDGFMGREEHAPETADNVPNLFAMLATAESHAQDPMILRDTRAQQRDDGHEATAIDRDLADRVTQKLAELCPYGDAGVLRALVEFPEYSDREIGSYIGRSHEWIRQQRNVIRGMLECHTLLWEIVGNCEKYQQPPTESHA